MPNPEELRHHLRQVVGAPTFAGRMSDRRFDQDARLAAIDQVLRVRRYHSATEPPREELAWKGPTTISPEGYKARQELEARLAGGAPVSAILEALGFGVVHAIDRHVEIFAVTGAVARIEWYPACDTLVEVEGTPEAIEAAIAVMGLPRIGFTADPLVTFAARWAARHGQPARLWLETAEEQPLHWPQ